MDKETLSNYGWIVIAVLVLVVMIALATPFGTFVADAVKSTTKGLFDVNQGALNSANVPGLTVDDQEFEDNSGENTQEPPVPVELTTLTTKTWNGLTSFYGDYVWTDGTNTYYSKGSDQYVLNGDTWETKTWDGLTIFNGDRIWNDGTNTYYSDDSDQYVLNGDTWEPKTWNGYTDFYGHNIWTDGTNYYYSSGSTQYIFS